MDFVFTTRIDAEPPCVVLGIYSDGSTWNSTPLLYSEDICRTVADKLDFSYSCGLLNTIYKSIDSPYIVNSFNAWELRLFKLHEQIETIRHGN